MGSCFWKTSLDTHDKHLKKETGLTSKQENPGFFKPGPVFLWKILIGKEMFPIDPYCTKSPRQEATKELQSNN